MLWTCGAMGTQIKQTQLFTRGSLTAGTTSRLWRNNSRFGHCGRVPTAHRNQKTAVRPRLRYRVQVPARGLFPIQARHPCVHFAISPTATSALPSESVTHLNPPLPQRPLPTRSPTRLPRRRQQARVPQCRSPEHCITGLTPANLANRSPQNAASTAVSTITTSAPVSNPSSQSSTPHAVRSLNHNGGISDTEHRRINGCWPPNSEMLGDGTVQPLPRPGIILTAEGWTYPNIRY